MMKRFENKEWRDSMRLRVDYNNMMRKFAGTRGINPEALASRKEQYDAAALCMEEKRSEMKWRALPFNQAEVVSQILETAAWVRANCDAFVVLGIGGSALGPIAVQQALSHLRYNDLPSVKRNGPKLYVEDNVDPERMASLRDVLDPARTVFNVITKSGSTSETMSQLLWGNGSPQEIRRRCLEGTYHCYNRRGEGEPHQDCEGERPPNLLRAGWRRRPLQ